MSSRVTTMPCALCGQPCDNRPVTYEAMCWDCWRDEFLDGFIIDHIAKALTREWPGWRVSSGRNPRDVAEVAHTAAREARAEWIRRETGIEPELSPSDRDMLESWVGLGRVPDDLTTRQHTARLVSKLLNDHDEMHDLVSQLIEGTADA